MAGKVEIIIEAIVTRMPSRQAICSGAFKWIRLFPMM